jgi:hypothetical protein
MLHCHCFQEVVMKKATIFHLVLGLLIIPLAASCLVLTPRLAMAQYQYAPYSEASENFSREELAQLLAPIALYPDPLLSQILMASTYPIEVIEADRWVSRNPQLQGDALDWALVERDWDPSVKALCHFPSILALMSERIAETTDLGNAFLAQEAEVMAMVQDLRATAYAQGNLTTNAQQTVIVERETIIIEPANPRVIYVPYYDPYYVYGSWWYPAYPPYFWGPPGSASSASPTGRACTSAFPSATGAPSTGIATLFSSMCTSGRNLSGTIAGWQSRAPGSTPPRIGGASSIAMPPPPANTGNPSNALSTAEETRATLLSRAT